MGGAVGIFVASPKIFIEIKLFPEGLRTFIIVLAPLR
jgi:hypothetical protein